jgi:periplasmic protein CpxP/Spy
LRKLSVKTAILASVVTVGILVSGPQIAQSHDAPPGQSGYRRRTPDELVVALASKLSLSDDQKAKIKPIIEDRQEKMRALAESGRHRMKKAHAMKSIMKDSDKRINVLLNKDQQKKYAEIKEQMREQAKQRRQESNAQN